MSQAFDLDRLGGRRALADLVDEVCACGEEALRLLRGGAGARAMAKPDRSPVTEADRAVEARLRAFVARRFPGVGFVGEEEGESGPSEAGIRFIVDPIDGTRAFMRGLPSWSILVGVEADGEPAVGVAHLPGAGELCVGVRGEGATGDGRPLRVSAVAALRDAVVGHGGVEAFLDAGVGPLLLSIGEQAYTMRSLADFDNYRQLLHGRVDAVIDPVVKPWDVCAVAVLVREAGGRFTDLTGRETIHGGSFVASNGHVHDALLAVTRTVSR